MQSEGIVLKSTEYRERQRIITLFTPDRGVISLMVFGVSKSNPQLLNLSSPLSRIECHYEKARGELYRYREGALLDLHPKVRSDLSSLRAAGKMLQLLLKTQLPEEPATPLYSLLLCYLQKLPDFSQWLASSFTLKLLRYEGLLRLEEQCSECKRPLENPHVSKGQCYCEKCSPPCQILLSSEEWKIFRRLTEAKNFSELPHIQYPPKLEETLTLLTDEILS